MGFKKMYVYFDNPKVKTITEILPLKMFTLVITPYLITLVLPLLLSIDGTILTSYVDCVLVVYLNYSFNILPNLLTMQLLSTIDYVALHILLIRDIFYRFTPYIILEQVYSSMIDSFTLTISSVQLINMPNHGTIILSTLLNMYEGSFLVIDFTTTRIAITSFSIKFILIILLLIFVRGGIPRYRFDFLTKMGWFKYFSWVLLFFLTTYFFYLLFS